MSAIKENTTATAQIYTERIIAFGDILGWKQACLTDDQAALNRMKNATDEIQKYAAVFTAERKQKLKDAYAPIGESEYMGIEFGIFSDNFAISMPSDTGYRIFDILSNLCHPLLCSGFSMRGGVTIGKLHHVGNVVFGPALIEAVRLEEEAHYPRLICSPKLLRHLADFSPNGPAIIITDHLGRKIANPFAFGIEHSSQFLDERWSISEIQKNIEKQIVEFSKKDEDEKIAEKWMYLREALPLMLQRFK